MSSSSSAAPSISSFFFFLFFLVLSAKSDLDSDKAALLAFQAAVGSGSLSWSADIAHCKWPGVGCDAGGGVIAVRLPASRLLGTIPPGVLGNLTRLRALSLRFNALTGNLPSDIGNCTQLRSIYLQGNQLHGEIPPALFGLRNLVHLDLSANRFSGRMSPAFNNLSRLRTLFLQWNRFEGRMPHFRLKLVLLNVSYNQLVGPVPSGLQSMPESAFAGNSLCGSPLAIVCTKNVSPVPSPAPGTSSPAAGADVKGKSSEKDKKKNLSGGAIAGIVMGSVVGFLALLVVLLVVRRRSSGRNARSVDIASVKPPAPPEVEETGEKRMLRDGVEENGIYSTGNAAAKKLTFFGNVEGKVFDLEDLLRASAEVLGKGTFGTAYKAVLEIGISVAVKRLKEVVISESEFRQKIEAVGSMDHENVVPLRAYYYSQDEKLLVYDYMPMGSLSALLHGSRGAGRTPLNWETRSGIALGAARGIEYLHHQGANICHGNIKSSNILLTKNNGARVSDFGLSHLVGPGSNPNRVGGYRAPEVIDPRLVSQRSDVYSFGVLLLELLTGKAPAHAVLNEEGIDLPRWVQSVVREDWTSEVFDLELLRYQSVEEEMVQLLQLAVDCCDPYPDRRPKMPEVVRRIEELHRSIQRESDQNQNSVDDTTEDGSSRRTDLNNGRPPAPPALFD